MCLTVKYSSAPPVRAGLLARVLVAWSLTVSSLQAGDAFYVWQRDWQERVTEAVLAETESRLFVLVAEWGKTGDSALVRMRIPWDTVRSALPRVVPVFRVAVGHLAEEGLPEAIASEFRRLRRDSGHEFVSLQLDLDCPERRLAEYAGVLRALRGQLPGIALSGTILPCQLDRSQMKQVVQALDFTVLQVHGLTVPKHVSAPASLVDRRTAVQALKALRRMSRPFMVALPTYAYEMRFDAAAGSFVGLGAEGPAVSSPGTTRRILQPDWNVVVDIVRQTRACEATGGCSGVAWFRLPVPGDRLCLERSAVSELQAGRRPAHGLTAMWRQGARGRHDLLVSNRAILSVEPVVIRLEWPRFRGDYDLLNGYAPVAGNRLSGVVPTTIAGPVPPPGQSLVVGWFRAPGPPGEATVILPAVKTESD